MTAEAYLNFLEKKIHTVVTAVTDESGHPVTCVMDIMHSDETGIYFLTAKGKSLYRRLRSQAYMALSGFYGTSTMTSVAISVRRQVREVGDSLLPLLLQKNPYMYEIYPTPESRQALTVFHLYAGSGEWFDLSKKPIERASFTFGGAKAICEQYLIGSNCTCCHKCETVCPQQCISFPSDSPKALIQQEHCLHCGRCMVVCPAHAVIRTNAQEV